MSNNSGCEVFTTPFKMLRFLFGIYLIPQTFGFLRLIDDELSFSSAAHLRPLAAGSITAIKTGTGQGLDDAVMKADAFIKSLETFDALKNLKQSAQALAVSTKALVEVAGTTSDHEYSAPLYTFVRLEHESFPDVQYHVTVADTKDQAKDWTDLLVHRADGVFFAFKAYRSRGHEIGLYQLACITDYNDTVLFYDQFSRPVTHTVVVGVEFLTPDGMRFSYLVDTEDPKNPLTVTV